MTRIREEEEVLGQCWLGHLTRKIVSEMSYNVCQVGRYTLLY